MNSKKSFLLRNLSILFIAFISSASGQNNPWGFGMSFIFSNAASTIEAKSFSIGSILEIEYTWQNKYHIGTQVSLSYVSLDRGTYGKQSSIRTGNPVFSFGYKNEIINEKVKLDYLLVVGLPLATYPGNIPDNRLAEFNLNNLNCANGWKDPNLFITNIVPIAFKIKAEGKVNDNLILRANLSPARLFSVNSRPSRNTYAADMEVDYNFKISNIRMGIAAFYSGVSLENNDKNQHSVWLGTDLKYFERLFKVDVIINLDKPYGVYAGNSKTFWGLRLKVE